LHLPVPDPSSELTPQLFGKPTAPLSPPPFRHCWAQAPCGMTGALPLWDRHQPGKRQLYPPACQETHPLGRAGPSSTGFPDNCSTRLLLGPPLESYKCA
jgi:hypothetical protein